ncbi:hypothetical protein M408DRAFT_149464 [Serendipita vermifera MAFF 305830]|uniref:Uncharacterized protein n=1 Tax=Serendipita vermifera MAFF 305830 TaxID=933852 RepID=A0A0C2X4W3_SERVB|nr:hypothetical protein M408DRAFT_149464 [Serendipita vermifera MAFF 305830]
MNGYFGGRWTCGYWTGHASIISTLALTSDDGRAERTLKPCQSYLRPRRLTVGMPNTGCD